MLRVSYLLFFFRDLCRELLEYQKNNSWYIVTLKQLNFIPIEEINNVLNSPSMALQSTMGPSIAHCIDAVIRSTMLSTLLAPGKSPRMFYLPPNQHTEADVNRLLDELQRYHVSTAATTAATYGLFNSY
jgi:hypothetical protein